MSIRTFWLILLKVIGLFLLHSSLSVIPTLVAVPMMLSQGLEPNNIVYAAILLAAFVVYAALIYLFIFRSGYLIKLFKLEDDFEEEDIELEVQAVTVLTFAVILVGGIMFVTGLPELVKQVAEYLSLSKFYGAETGVGWLVYYAAQCAIGLLLIFKHKQIAGFIEQMANDSRPPNEGDVLDPRIE